MFGSNLTPELYNFIIQLFESQMHTIYDGEGGGSGSDLENSCVHSVPYCAKKQTDRQITLFCLSVWFLAQYESVLSFQAQFIWVHSPNSYPLAPLAPLALLRPA